MTQRNERVIRMAGLLKEMADEALRRPLRIVADRDTRPVLPMVLSENGALMYAGAGSALADLNARATEMRYADIDRIDQALTEAFAEDPVNCIKLIFQMGDVRCGKGERRFFNTAMDWMTRSVPKVALEVLPLIPEYTRWDYLVRLTVCEDKEVAGRATELVKKQFRRDLAAVRALESGENLHREISLLGKWMPSLQVKTAEGKKQVRHLLKALHLQERDYRHALSELRAHLNVIEKAMSAKDYASIDMEKMTSRQQLRYSGFLKRKMARERHEYIQAVLRGEKHMNASVLNPIEIVHQYTREYSNSDWYCTSLGENEDFEALWSLLPDKTNGNGNTLVVRDGSGSMTAPLGQGSSATMLEAADAMAIYCAEHLQGPFRNLFLTFSSRPQVVDISDCRTLSEKLNRLNRFCDCSNTDIEATFDLVLKIAVENHLSQEELPSYLLILSDMEFDAARGAYSYDRRNRQLTLSRATLFETIRRKWRSAGYEMPTLVFWHLNGSRTIFPETDAKSGVIFLSGFSTTELELVMAGAFERLDEITREVEVKDEVTGEVRVEQRTVTERVVLSPKEQLMKKLEDPRYDAVEEAARRGLRAS